MSRIDVCGTRASHIREKTMDVTLEPLQPQDTDAFAAEMQEAFQLAVDAVSDDEPLPVLPRQDIDESLANPGAVALVATCEGRRVGGTVLFLDEKTHEHACALLYVRADAHGRGIGAALWKAIEKRYPDALAWKLCTPYFEVRNIHFYLRKCGFHIVDLVSDPETGPADASGKGSLMFSFVKRLDGRWE